MVAVLVRNPVYHQLNKILRELIRGGEYPLHHRFLTEREVSQRFGVSRATANKALSNLVAEGVLEFRKGVGTFVQGGVLDYDLGALVSFHDKARAAGKKPSTRVLCFETLPASQADEQPRKALGTIGAELLYRVERLRLADGVPVILEKRFILERHCPRLSKRDLEGSLYALWTRRYKLDIEGAEQVIRAVNLQGGDARHLKVRSGAAGLAVLSTGLLAGGGPVWWEETLYRGDAYEFQNRLGRIQTARPAAGLLRSV
jgi:GntR family transcriptional regulator